MNNGFVSLNKRISQRFCLIKQVFKLLLCWCRGGGLVGKYLNSFGGGWEVWDFELFDARNLSWNWKKWRKLSKKFKKTWRI